MADTSPNTTDRVYTRNTHADLRAVQAALIQERALARAEELRVRRQRRENRENREAANFFVRTVRGNPIETFFWVLERRQGVYTAEWDQDRNIIHLTRRDRGDNMGQQIEIPYNEERGHYMLNGLNLNLFRIDTITSEEAEARGVPPWDGEDEDDLFTVGSDYSDYDSSFGSINYWKMKSKKQRPRGGWKEPTVKQFYSLYKQAKKYEF